MKNVPTNKQMSSPELVRRPHQELSHCEPKSPVNHSGAQVVGKMFFYKSHLQSKGIHTIPLQHREDFSPSGLLDHKLS